MEITGTLSAECLVHFRAKYPVHFQAERLVHFLRNIQLKDTQKLGLSLYPPNFAKPLVTLLDFNCTLNISIL